MVEIQVKSSFKDLGLCDEMVVACKRVGWNVPTAIQAQVIPIALQGKDIVGLAETGSGKTGAFILPILHNLLIQRTKMFALVLCPNRELAMQISQHFEALGAEIDVKTGVLIGGIEKAKQIASLSIKPHIIIASPGRLIDHIENTRGFDLRKVQHLVIDEADKLLSLDFDDSVTKVLEVVPSNRKTYLFSATMTSHVNKLKRASLNNPIKISVSSKYDTSPNLLQHFKLVPYKYKYAFILALFQHFQNQIIMCFCNTCLGSRQLTLFLQKIGIPARCLHGQLSQWQRHNALTIFKAGHERVLVCTDVASRGLDIMGVQIVCNVDVPISSKDYIHRVGRTARAGKSGRAITIVTQYDVVLYQQIENTLKMRLDEFKEIDDNIWRDELEFASRLFIGVEEEIKDEDIEKRNRETYKRRKRRKIR